MGRYDSPRGGYDYDSPPRRERGYGGGGGRGRSPSRRGGGYGGGGAGRQTTSLLVRNIPSSSRAEDLREPFERFGPVRDVYLPKDYYTGEPRGFAFVEFIDGRDASEAQYQMNRQIFCGREISVVLAAQNRKRPEDMRTRERFASRSSHGHGSRRPYRGRSRSRSYSRSPSPRYRDRSRSYSPAPRRRNYSNSLSPNYSRSPRKHDDDDNNNNRSPAVRGSRSRSAELSPSLSR